MTQDVQERFGKLSTRWKVGIVALALLAVAPVTYFMLVGLLGLLAVGAAVLLGAVGIAVAPVISMKLANWQMKAVIAEATENPIETRWNNWKEEMQNLESFGTQIQSFEGK